MNDLYSFIYRGILTDESLDKAGRIRKKHFGSPDAAQIQKTLSFDFLDQDRLTDAQFMSITYVALHSFENMIRSFVQKAMAEHYGDTWWDNVPERIKKNVQSRMDEDAKFRWHGVRGASQMNYCDFGDLSSIIITNWALFEAILTNMEWAKAILNTLEKSRNIIMHGGILAREDIERIGINIRDWIRQTG